MDGQPPLTLTDVLRQISSEALDGIFNTNPAFGRGSLGACRSVCRALRDIVDGCVTRIDVRALATNTAFLHGEDLFSLARFKRCSQVYFTASCLADSDDEEVVGDEVDLGTPVVSFFTSQPQEVRARISHVGVFFEEDESSVRPAGALSALPLVLPNLRSLNLLECCSFNLADFRLFFRALATLPHLEELDIDTQLGPLGFLAGSTSLKILRGAFSDDPGFLHAVSRLPKLEELHLHHCGDVKSSGPALVRLMDSLPPAMRSLELDHVCVVNQGSIVTNFYLLSAKLHGGKYSEISLEDREFLSSKPLDRMAAVASELLLPCAALSRCAAAEERPVLRIESIKASSTEALEDPALAATLSSLRRRFSRIEVRFLSWDLGMDAPLKAMELLGMPASLEVSYSAASHPFSWRLPCRGTASVGLGGGMREDGASASHASPAAPSPAGSLPGPLELMRLAVELLAAEKPGRRCKRLVLLRGPFVALLLQSPQALAGWVRWLEGKAAAAGVVGAARPANNSEVREDEEDEEDEEEIMSRLNGAHLITSAQPLPPFDALLLKCNGLKGAIEAVMAAARDAAVVAGGTAAAGLEVVPVTWPRSEEEQGPATRVFVGALQKVLDSKWVAPELAGAAATAAAGQGPGVEAFSSLHTMRQRLTELQEIGLALSKLPKLSRQEWEAAR